MTRTLGAAFLMICLATTGASACTGIVRVIAGAVIAAGNEDNSKTDASMGPVAASETSYGAIYFGFHFNRLANRLSGWYEMQGVNDQGLYYDLFSTPCQSETSETAGGGYGPPEAIERTLMKTCATESEALAFLHRKNYARILPCVQTLLVDRAGNAAVYAGGVDVFRTTPGFVVTNF